MRYIPTIPNRKDERETIITRIDRIKESRKIPDAV